MVSRSREGKTVTYEYTNYIAPSACINFLEIEDFLAGFYGKSSRNLPSRIIDGTSEELIYDWTMSDGLPVRLILTEMDSKGEDVDIITFEWQ